VQQRIEQQNEALSAQTQETWPTPYKTFDALTLPRREWVYGYDYIKKYISVTASAGGIGKTSAIIVEAIAISTGKDLLGVQVKEQTNVWIISSHAALRHNAGGCTRQALHGRRRHHANHTRGRKQGRADHK
jgi:RecA-family ATPase